MIDKMPGAVIITSRLDGEKRRYSVSRADAYHTSLMPDAGDAKPTHVETWRLLDGLALGTIESAA